MFVAPGTAPDFGQKLTHEAAERLAGNWSRLLLNGLTLIVAGVLIFSINWSIRSLATFIGAASEPRHRTAVDRHGHRHHRLARSGDRRARDLPRRMADRHRHAHDLGSLRRPPGPFGLVAAADHRPARDPAGRPRPRQPGGDTGRAHHCGRDLGGRRRRDAHRAGLRDQAAPGRGRQGLDLAGPERHGSGRQARRGEARRGGIVASARFLWHIVIDDPAARRGRWVVGVSWHIPNRGRLSDRG
jgi:hypothetical protein